MHPNVKTTSLHGFIILLLLLEISCESDSSDSLENGNITTTKPISVMTTNQNTIFINGSTTVTTTAPYSSTTASTTTSTTANANNTTTSAVGTSVSTILSNTSTALSELTTSDVGSSVPSKSSSRHGWWLFVALIVTVVVVGGIGVIYYHRNHTPYRRFLRNWRSRDDEADNIILQLEQPELMNGQWPPRISFA
ncbi:unnamed protein product [Adineta ricciae]|uniref:Uncharacterized protein n=1 Tax=Adineta ricciae TaxID=249248 RepID=A0A813ZBL4_ADIRI|nr:unnamed protein product [Adineta ricciae]CAF1055039.1 unnamed protein product [Adineta ricciae]